MLRAIGVAAGFACGALLAGCAADVAPQTTFDHAPHAPATVSEQGDTAPQIFEVRLRGERKAETILQQILKAGHSQLIEACEGNPGESVRVYTPLASGADADVPCAAILHGGEMNGQCQQALTSEPVDGVIRESQQPFTPIGLLCGLLSIGTTLASTWACTRYPDRWCPWPAAAGSSTISLVCAFL